METTQHKSAYLTRHNCDKHVHNLKQNKKKLMDLNIKKKKKKNHLIINHLSIICGRLGVQYLSVRQCNSFLRPTYRKKTKI